MSKSVHLIGICGSGMSALAHLLLDRGFSVSGSDCHPNYNARQLAARGVVFYSEHRPENLSHADFVVTSRAVPKDNPELLAAFDQKIPVFSRAEFLAQTLAEKKTILVCGTHGKSSTAAMLAKILRDCGLQPAYYIGGNVPDLGSPGAWGQGSWAVVEGDESDGSAAVFSPTITIILNANWEHVDYFGSQSEVEDFFRKIAQKTSHKVVCCVDSLRKEFLEKIKCNPVYYGTAENCELRLKVHSTFEARPTFDVITNDGTVYTLRLHIPGVHQIFNATAALLAATLAGCDLARAIESVKTFSGVERRLQKIGDNGKVSIYSDYAHHPVEVCTTVKTARKLACGRLIVVFQPHRYSRSLAFCDQYGPAFSHADILFLTEVYAAGERQPENFNGMVFAERVKKNTTSRTKYCGTQKRLFREVLRELKDGDTVLVMGAGDIHSLAQELAEHKSLESKLQKLLEGNGRLKTMHELAPYTTMRIGGPAEFFVEPFTEQCAADILRFAKANKLPVTILGRGSNVLIKDGGIRGIVLRLPREKFSEMRINGTRITAGAATRLKELVHFASRNNLGGIEFLEGIPGSLGGALRMNAGAMGNCIFDVVIEVTCLDQNGNSITYSRQQIHAAYRSVPELVDKLILSATLQCQYEEKEKILEKIHQFALKRWQSQPSLPSAGCIFKNPDWGPAGRLIDIMNLKGLSEGGASVSTIHGNFFVNKNSATAADMLRLMEKVKSIVREKLGIELENEVVILGEDP